MVIEQGKYYQYPMCCINYYIERIKASKFKNDKVIPGTCFEPCPECWNSGKINVKNFMVVWDKNNHNWIVEEN